jgi:hypothetical protein
MQDPYTGKAGTFIVDGAVGVRYPAEDAEIYQFDPSAYRADPDAARAAFEKAKKVSKKASGQPDAQPEIK